MKEEWMIKNKQADFAGLAAGYNVPPLLIKLIINRGIEEENIGVYLRGTLKELHDPALMKDLVKAADMLMELADRGEQIAIVSDYDCDGIFSGMILYTGLKKIGANPVVYTPDRVSEGYGINKRIIDEIYNRGINYIITCDNGIAAYDEIGYAKELGMKVIITDHHEIQGNIPKADAVCNPKQEECAYPFKGLCGGGVAYKLMTYIYERENVLKDDKNAGNILLEYAAIATIADMMELKDENRIIVKEGLKLLNNSSSVGLNAIKTVNGLEGKNISTYHIGFVIGPCFNAAGRIETAATAYDLLMCENEQEAHTLAFKLKELNEERKQMTEDATESALLLLDNTEYENDRVIVLTLKDCHESIVGIVAGRIKEKICKPVIVFSEVENGLVKGSGRSIAAYNMFEELLKLSDLFERFGGHAMAAGITMKQEKVELLRQGLNEQCMLTEKDFVSKVSIDAEVIFRHMNEEVIRNLFLLEPCGLGNVKPLFVVRHANIRAARILGKNQNVLRLTLVDGEGNVIDGILFNQVDEFINMIEEKYGAEQKDYMLRGRNNNIDVSLTFYPEINEYNGRRTIQLVVQNFRVI